MTTTLDPAVSLTVGFFYPLTQMIKIISPWYVSLVRQMYDLPKITAVTFIPGVVFFFDWAAAHNKVTSFDNQSNLYYLQNRPRFAWKQYL